ncbi:Rieske (2Fe-2S) protein [Luteococcus sediminum]
MTSRGRKAKLGLAGSLSRRGALRLGGLSVAAAVTASGCGTRGPATEVAAADVPVGKGLVLHEQGLVVTQPEAGHFEAFDAHCTHAGCQVSEFDERGIVCVCHDSVFSTTDGSVLHGPAKEPLARAQVTTDGDRLVVRA